MKKVPLYLIAVFAIVVVISAMTVGVYYSRDFFQSYINRDPQKVVMLQLSLMKQGEIFEAYQLTSTPFRQATTLRELSRFVDRYAMLRSYKTILLKSKMAEGKTVSLEFKITGKNDQHAMLNYDLIREDNKWKVLHIQINPASASHQSQIKKSFDRFSQAPPDLSKVFDNKESRYLVNYPEKWNYLRLDNGSIVFNGEPGTRAFYSTINVQTILSKKSGGRFDTVKALIDDIKVQVNKRAKNAIFLESGPITLAEKNGVKANGEYLIFTYSYNGYSYQQWDVIVLRNDGNVFYVWAYTSPMKQYSNDLPLAKAMLKAWQIY